MLRAALALCLLSARFGLAASTPTPADSATPGYKLALETSQAVIGKALGDYALRDRLNREVRLAGYRGKPLLVSFVYTGCFGVCPITTRFLAKSVQAARAALGPDSFNVVTIGFNQPFDSPAAMAEFARQNGVADPRWEFLSPDAGTLAALTRDLGFTYYATPKGFDHITQLSVIDAEGVIYRQIYGDSYTLPTLVDPLKDLLSGQTGRAVSIDSIWTKVKLFCTVYDPNSGGYRVNYSLFFEIFTGLTVLGSIAWFLLRERRRRSPAH
jgi:protein SCO1/2